MALNPEALLRERIAILEDQLAEAREIIAYMEAEQDAGEAPPEPWMHLAAALVLEPRVAQVLAVLHRADGPITHESILDEVWGSGRGRKNGLSVALWKLRRDLAVSFGEQTTVQTVPRAGLMLTPHGRRVVDEALVRTQREVA